MNDSTVEKLYFLNLKAHLFIETLQKLSEHGGGQHFDKIKDENLMAQLFQYLDPKELCACSLGTKSLCFGVIIFQCANLGITS